MQIFVSRCLVSVSNLILDGSNIKIYDLLTDSITIYYDQCGPSVQLCIWLHTSSYWCALSQPNLPVRNGHTFHLQISNDNFWLSRRLVRKVLLSVNRLFVIRGAYDSQTMNHRVCFLLWNELALLSCCSSTASKASQQSIKRRSSIKSAWSNGGCWLIG